jgi:hypothetical protein
MKSIIIFLLLFFSHNIHAKHNYFEYFYPIKFDISRGAPQMFLFNNKGELILKTSSFYPGLKNALTFTQEISNGKEIKSNLMKLLNISPEFDESDFTLYYLVFDPDVGLCPPCDKQVKVIEQLEKKISNVKINFNKVELKVDKNWTPANEN